MNIEPILERLKEDYHLKENHLSVIRILYENNLAADDICKKTRIPKGRIYEFLNELIVWGLVSKKKSTPAYYYIDDFAHRMFNFLDTNFRKVLASQSAIVSMLDAGNSKIVKIIENRQDYVANLIKLLETKKSIKAISRSDSVPYFLYPRETADYLEVRKHIKEKRDLVPSSPGEDLALFEAFKRFWAEGKKYSSLSNYDTVISYFKTLCRLFGKAKYVEVVKEIIDDINKYHVKIQLVKDYFPINVHFSDNHLLLAFTHSEGILLGILTSYKSQLDIYSSLFDKKIKNALDLVDVLKKELK